MSYYQVTVKKDIRF